MKLNSCLPLGLVSETEKESLRASFKRSNATPVKPHEGELLTPPESVLKSPSLIRATCWRIPTLSQTFFCSCCFAEISSRADVKVEGDKRLDKLESFLDKLHNKGTVSVSLQNNKRTSMFLFMTFIS